MRVLILIAIALVAYFLGGINGSIIASKFIFRQDVRDYGSGNPGITNFYRTYGKMGAALVFAVDVIKSIIAILVGGWLMGLRGNSLMSTEELQLIGRLFAGFCLILGHMYPVYYQFRGGKGVLCSGVWALMVDWRVGLVCWLVFIAIVAVTRYVSLGSIVGILCVPVGMLAFHSWLEFVLALLCALLVVIKHHQNISRLIAGTESKLGASSKK